jgi:polyhydroxybutyrate depolymerase
MRICLLSLAVAVAACGGGAAGSGDGTGSGGDGCLTPGAFPPGDRTVTIPHGGVDRNYLVHVPASYDGRRPVPWCSTSTV